MFHDDYSVGLNSLLKANQQVLNDENYQTQNKINSLIAAGMYVVVGLRTVDCPSTDAILGDAVVFCGSFSTRWEAEKHAQFLRRNDEELFGIKVEPQKV